MIISRHLVMIGAVVTTAGSLVASPLFAWTSWVGALEDWPKAGATTPETTPASASNPTTSPPAASPAVSPGSPSATSAATGTSTAGSPIDSQYEARIRPLFIRVDNNAWQAAPKVADEKPAAPLSKAFSWDVCFSGRGEGQVTGLLESAAKDPMPPYLLRPEDRAAWRTRRSQDFMGVNPAPVYKPILLMSSLNSSCKDPEKWKQGGGEKVKGKVPALIAELRKQFAFENPDLPSYEFKDQDVKIFRSWASAKKGIYVTLKPRPKDPTLETFYVSLQNEMTYVGRNMLLVDASDFDGDGVTELLFKRRAEKKDVYELLIGPKSVAQSHWAYP